MKGKVMWFVAVGMLAAGFFAASFVVSMYLGRRLPVPARASGATTRPASASGKSPSFASVSAASLTPKEQELDDLVRELHRRLAACHQKEQQLDDQAKRIQIARGLLRKQAQEMEDLRVQLVEPFTQAKEAQAQLEHTRVVITQQEVTNLKKAATIYDKMDADSGAQILESMCKDNREDDVVKLLHYMQDRTAANMLAAIKDKALAAQLCEKLKQIQQ